VVRHQRIRQEANGLLLLGLSQYGLEGGVVVVFVEEDGAIRGPIQGVVGIAAGVAMQAASSEGTNVLMQMTTMAYEK
jgi:hypothetical protein